MRSPCCFRGCECRDGARWHLDAHEVISVVIVLLLCLVDGICKRRVLTLQACTPSKSLRVTHAQGGNSGARNPCTFNCRMRPQLGAEAGSEGFRAERTIASAAANPVRSSCCRRAASLSSVSSCCCAYSVAGPLMSVAQAQCCGGYSKRVQAIDRAAAICQHQG